MSALDATSPVRPGKLYGSYLFMLIFYKIDSVCWSTLKNVKYKIIKKKLQVEHTTDNL